MSCFQVIMIIVKKFIFSSIYLRFVILFFEHITEINSEKALLFSDGRQIFDEIPKSPALYYSACPAESQSESEFNNTESLSKKSLFLKKSVQITEKVLEDNQFFHVSLAKCKHSSQPSILVNRTHKFFQIGFEIYTGPNKSETEKLKYHFSSVAAWKTMKKSSGILSKKSGTKQKRSELQFNSRNFSDSARVTKKTTHIKPPKNASQSPWFHWIPIFSFEFDLEQFASKKIVYSGDLGKYDATFKCSEYIVDKDLYGHVDFTSIFRNENQDELFKGLPAFPRPSVLPSQQTPLQYQCGHIYGCLKQHQVIPHYYYHSQASKLSTCSTVNILPVWENISNGPLKKVDQYLYAITQLWGNKITITTGTFGILSYPKKKSYLHERLPIFHRTIYMDKNKKVPVPKIIYKIVTFENNMQEEYHVVIVTHNDPAEKEIKHICHPVQIDELRYEKLLLSWKFINNIDKESGWTYSCPMTTEVLDNLGVYRRRSSDERLRTLFLEDFSPIDKNGVRMLTFDEIKELIHKEFKNLFES